MGILNVTPDSFSDGGAYLNSEQAIAAALKMVSEGADIIDIGGESTRPDATMVDKKIEQQRILPIISALSKIGNIIISVDTYHSETAFRAIAAGAHIINDVGGLQKDSSMAAIAAQTGAGMVIMHTSRDREKDPDVLEDQKSFFAKSLRIAAESGIKHNQIVLDPGFGFGKNFDENIELMRIAESLNMFHFPLLAATSRKQFLGALSGKKEAENRDVETAATSIILRMAGFSLFRVHNIPANLEMLTIADACRKDKK